MLARTGFILLVLGLPLALRAADTPAAVAAPAGLVITLRQEGQSGGEHVLLKEVADFSGLAAERAASLERLTVGRAASPGQSRVFT